MPQAFVIGVMIASTITMVFQMKWNRTLHRHNMELRTERIATHALIQAILDKTDGMITCDGCGRPITEGEAAAVRITPVGPMFGHVMCLPPMPVDVA